MNDIGKPDKTEEVLLGENGTDDGFEDFFPDSYVYAFVDYYSHELRIHFGIPNPRVLDEDVDYVLAFLGKTMEDREEEIADTFTKKDALRELDILAAALKKARQIINNLPAKQYIGSTEVSTPQPKVKPEATIFPRR